MLEDQITTLGAASGEVAGLSIFALIDQADVVVKAVMLGLLLASVWSWTIIFQKMWRFRGLHRKAQQFERDFWGGAKLGELYKRFQSNPDHPMAMAFVVGWEEWKETPPPKNASAVTTLLTRISKVMSLTVDREMELIERYLSSLATIGATAPFVGLFGTIWGIMNSFQSIALTKNTTLAVVAPGIAEALLATAFGLVAAIPAVVAYNKFSGDADRYANRVGTFTDEFAVILSRDLEDMAGGAYDSTRAA